MLIHYVRDEQNRPIGAVVAINRNQIGWSLFNPNDKTFSKKFAVKLAIDRAENPRSLIAILPRGHLCVPSVENKGPNFHTKIMPVLPVMAKRARKYFKEQ